MTEHEKELLRAIAEGKRIQASHGFGWLDVTNENALQILGKCCPSGWMGVQLRIKPATMLVNGIEVPAAETKAPEHGEKFWCPTYWDKSGVFYSYWGLRASQILALKRGFIHLSKENAIAHAEALGWCEEVKK